jgi:Glycosyl hydrolase family 85
LLQLQVPFVLIALTLFPLLYSIFEWEESKPDLEKCLYGSMSQLRSSDAKHEAGNLPFSTVCASKLIKLAKNRNFDGYLINIETDLNFLPPVSCYPRKSQEERDEDAASMERETKLAGLEALVSSDIKQRRERRMVRNASLLASWVGWLREEGKRLVGPHWDVIWCMCIHSLGNSGIDHHLSCKVRFCDNGWPTSMARCAYRCQCTILQNL